MKLPDENTPAGTPCWVRDSDTQWWQPGRYEGFGNAEFPHLATVGAAPVGWKQCRLDDPYAPKLPEGFTPCNGRPEGLADEDVVAVVLREGTLGDGGGVRTVKGWIWTTMDPVRAPVGYKLIEKAPTPPIPHVHHDKIVQWAADPSQKVWCRLRNAFADKWCDLECAPCWHPELEYHIGEEPPKPEPRMITIEGHTFAAPSKVETETHTCGLADALWIRQQDVAAYLAAKDALMALAIARALEGM